MDSGVDIKAVYLIGGMVIILFLLLTSFVISSWRISKLEQVNEDLQNNIQDLERTLSQYLAYGETFAELSDLITSRRLDLPALRLIQDKLSLIESITPLREQVEALQSQMESQIAEQQQSYQNILNDQQGLSASLSQIKTLLASLPTKNVAQASQAEANSRMQANLHNQRQYQEQRPNKNANKQQAKRNAKGGSRDPRNPLGMGNYGVHSNSSVASSDAMAQQDFAQASGVDSEHDLNYVSMPHNNQRAKLAQYEEFNELGSDDGAFTANATLPRERGNKYVEIDIKRPSDTFNTLQDLPEVSDDEVSLSSTGELFDHEAPSNRSAELQTLPSAAPESSSFERESSAGQELSAPYLSALNNDTIAQAKNAEEVVEITEHDIVSHSGDLSLPSIMPELDFVPEIEGSHVQDSAAIAQAQVAEQAMEPEPVVQESPVVEPVNGELDSPELYAGVEQELAKLTESLNGSQSMATPDVVELDTTDNINLVPEFSPELEQALEPKLEQVVEPSIAVTEPALETSAPKPPVSDLDISQAELEVLNPSVSSEAEAAGSEPAAAIFEPAAVESELVASEPVTIDNESEAASTSALTELVKDPNAALDEDTQALIKDALQDISELEVLEPESSEVKLESDKDATQDLSTESVESITQESASESEASFAEANDELRFDALNNFTQRYNKSRKKKAQEVGEDTKESKVAAKQEAKTKVKAPKFKAKEPAPASIAEQEALARENTKVATNEASPSLTIDFASADSLDEPDGLTVSVEQPVRASFNADTKPAKDKAYQKVDYANEEASDNVSGPVVDMIYDEDYVRRQKDEKPFGININTLDKAHTFIDAGVPLAEISAKTGLSEDELRLLYDVDEDGKVRDSSELFKASDDEEDEAHESSESSILSTESAASKSSSEESAGEKLSTKPLLENPVDALDHAEKQVIESIMKEQVDPFVGSEDASVDNVAEHTDSTLHSEEAADEAAAIEAKLKSKVASASEAAPSAIEHEEENELEHLQRIAARDPSASSDKLSFNEESLDEIDRLANTIIQENKRREQERMQAQGMFSQENASESIDDDPLNVLADFKHKQAHFTSEEASAAAQAIAQGFRNTADYQQALQADIDKSLEEDSVTLESRISESVKRSAQKAAQANQHAAAADTIAMSRGLSSLLSGNPSAPQSSAAPVGTPVPVKSARPLASSNMAIEPVGLQSTNQGIDRTAATIDIPNPPRANKITVDMALAQMDAAPARTPVASAPLAIGAVASSARYASYASASSRNPGMSDMVDIMPSMFGVANNIGAPLGLGSVQDQAATPSAEVEDPTAILNQVVSGGLNSVSTALNEEQLQTLAQIQSAGPTGIVNNNNHYANLQARNAYGIKRH